MRPSGGKKKSIIKKITTALLSLAVVVMAVAVAYLTYCNVSGRVAYICGHATVKIISPSMEPEIPVGMYIVCEEVQAEDVCVGDIILFYSRDPQIYGKINTHRVVEIHSDNGSYSFVTKGDNNLLTDAYPVLEEDLIGRYVRNADRLASFAGFFSNPTVFFVLVIIPAAILVIVSMKDVVKGAKEARMNALIESEIKRLQEKEKKDEAEKEQEHDVQKDEPETTDQQM